MSYDFCVYKIGKHTASIIVYMLAIAQFKF